MWHRFFDKFDKYALQKLISKYFTKELTFSPQVVYNIFIKNEKNSYSANQPSLVTRQPSFTV